MADQEFTGFVRVRGAREHNLKNVDLEIPRDALVVFTGVSGSGKSSLAFGTLYAEAQRRYLESVSPYARRLFHQMGVPEVDEIEGLPPAVALQQQRGSPTTRSSVGSVTTLSNLLRMLYSRAGDYPPRQPHLDAEAFSPNTPEGACPQCHGLGRIYEVTERSMVPDDSLTIRERAIAAWPTAWHGQNLRDILVTLGYDVDRPWRELPRKDRDWILFTDEQPAVPVYAGLDAARGDAARSEAQGASRATRAHSPSARRYVLHTFATTAEPADQEAGGAIHAEQRMPALPRQAAAPRVAVGDLRGLRHRRDLPACRSPGWPASCAPTRRARPPARRGWRPSHPEKALVAQRIAEDLVARTRRAARPRARLSGAGAQHAHPFARRAPAPAARHAGALQPVRRGLRARRALRGAASGGHRGAAAGARPAEEPPAIRCSSSSTSSTSIRHADWIVDVGPGGGRAGRPRALQRPARGARAGRGLADPAPSFRPPRASRPDAAPAQGLAAPRRASPATT